MKYLDRGIIYLQIKEEMLSTSSTILKNCYPKSWELDKDYVSRYYFPKDYAKCKIFNVEEDYFKIDLTIARGLDYYTGTVYDDVGNVTKTLGSKTLSGYPALIFALINKLKLTISISSSFVKSCVVI